MSVQTGGDRPDQQPEWGYEAALSDLDALESSLALEVERLSRMYAPTGRNPARSSYMGMPLWWWRYSLISWAHSRNVRSAHTGDTLRGLRVVLREWDDDLFLDFLHGLCSTKQTTVRGRAS
jgi:hypothetical protein